MKNIGVWMDKEKAHIVSLEKGQEDFSTLSSELEFFNPKGGSRSKVKWGPQEVVQDSRYLEREKHQLNNYFDKLATALSEADSIALYGPAGTNRKFLDALTNKRKRLADKVKIVATADSMTENQFRALVRDCFKD
ncbi:hypothetical protein [Zeaxanthinibacter enoshimensis]|uniref:Protein required for attachment to host cells n=1 Tax=Zeaxanthinibacter enoshimensis TaxID=392009 RepID=A0A4R6TJ66_9FLAO|nr:hypothetical protein [Zeaxanthinibacter enoshimensis]TDQ30894.1 hypothetical protein CLV82_1591 [Zeaxanthinibacter enoshimensis]